MIVLILALFPVLYLFQPRLALGALIAAIVIAYRRRVRILKPTHATNEKLPAAWKDPWNTDGVSS